MCLNPIKIRNNSRSFERYFAPLYRQVPCGHCAECAAALQSDWFVRLAYEWNYNKSIGGTVYLLTLTYNDEELPYFKVTEDIVNSLRSSLKRLAMEVPDVDKRLYEFSDEFGFSPYEYRPFSHNYFSKKDLSLFFKSFRQILNYDGKYKYNEQETIKYFVAGEYGHDLHRVHYHVILFLPFLISPADLMTLCRYAWAHSVKRVDCPQFILDRLDKRASLKNGITTLSTPNGKFWQDWFLKKNGSHIYVKHLRGNVAYSKKYPPQLSSVLGIEYVCKYVHKADEYLTDKKWYVLKQWLRLFPRKLDDYKYRYPEMYDYVKRLRAYFPIVHTSNFIGISVLDEFQLLDKEEVAKKFNTECIEIAGLPRKFRVPAYIINRVMYDKDNKDSSLRVLSEIGVETLKYRLNLRVDEYVKKIEDIMSTSVKLLHHEDYAKLREDFPMCFDGPLFTSNQPFFKTLAIYRYFFKDVECDGSIIFDDVTAVIDTFYYDYIDRQIYKRYDTTCRPSLLPPVAVAQRSKYTWNLQPCFCIYDKWLEYIEAIRLLVARRLSEQRQIERKEKNDIKNFFNTLLYAPF